MAKKTVASLQKKEQKLFQKQLKWLKMKKLEDIHLNQK